jgi:hypothetical protein
LGGADARQRGRGWAAKIAVPQFGAALRSEDAAAPGGASGAVLRSISNGGAHRAKLARMSIAMPRALRALCLGATLLVPVLAAGCDSKPGESGAAATGGSTATATATSAASPPQAAVDPAPPAPADLDVASLQKTLACGGAAKTGPCAVLAGFATCKAWSAEPPSGDGRWLGRGYEVEGKKTTEQVTVLRARRVPTSEVGAGQLPVRIALGSIDKSEGSPFTEADKAIRALERSDVPPKGNAAIEHLKQMTQWSEAFATRTVGSQVYGLSQGGLFVCEGPKRELYVVRRAATRTGTGDGLYAILWGATW